MRKMIGIFGGTFDPVHIGHLRLALELKEALRLDEMRLIPCHRPPHKTALQAASQRRADMLQLALQDCNELCLDKRELLRDQPSFTYDTLMELRAEVGEQASLILCMGADSFAALSTWYLWQKLIQLAHIVVINRPGITLPDTGPVAELLTENWGTRTSLTAKPAGSVMLLELRLLPISATEIRAMIKAGQSAQFLLPTSVWTYIREHNLYQ